MMAKKIAAIILFLKRRESLLATHLAIATRTRAIATLVSHFGCKELDAEVGSCVLSNSITRQVVFKMAIGVW